MNTMKKTLLGFAGLLGALLAPASARADGILVKTNALSAGAQKTLAAEIAAAKAKDPKWFDVLAKAELNGIDPAFYGQQRNPIPLVGRELRNMKAAGLLPMLEAVAFKTPARGSHTDAEWTALKVGLLEAIGVLGDTRAAPVVRAAFEAQTASGPVARAAAEAVGVLCGDDDLKLLQRRAAKSDVLFLDAVAGLGKCARVDAAKTLATLLSQTTGAQAAKVAEALGQVGADTVWQGRVRTSTDKAATEKAWKEVREVAGKALAKAFPQLGEDARGRVKFAVRMIKHPDMKKLLIAERAAAKPEAVKAIDELVGSLQ